MKAPAPPLQVALFVLLCLIWGSTWLVIREGVTLVPPLHGAFYRMLVAWLLLLAIGPALRRLEGAPRPPFWLSLSLGTTNFAASYAIIYWTERVLPSGLASVLWAVFPLLVVIAGHLFLGERLRRRQFAGLLLSFGGILVLFWHDVRALGPDGIDMALLLFVSPLVSVVSTVLVKKHGGGTSSVLLTRDALMVATALLWLAAVAVEGDAEFSWTDRGVFTVVYLGVIGTVVTFVIYFWLLRHAPAGRMSLIAFITPMLALTLGWLWGDGQPTLSALIGSGLVIAGVFATVRR